MRMKIFQKEGFNKTNGCLKNGKLFLSSPSDWGLISKIFNKHKKLNIKKQIVKLKMDSKQACERAIWQ